MDKEPGSSGAEDRKFTVKVSEPSQCARVLSIEIPAEEVVREEERIFQKLRSSLKIPGFRKGKVPAGYIKRNYSDVIHDDAVQNLLPAIYEAALLKEGIAALGQPKFENLKAEMGKGITVDITVEVRPEIKIERYRNILVQADKREVGEEQVNKALQELQQRMATYGVVGRGAMDSDYLVMDYAPLTDSGKVDTKRALRNYPVNLSSETLLKEFREGLMGLKAGDEKQIEVNYPQDFPDQELAGGRQAFRVKVKEVKERILPELNDDFAKGLGSGLKTLGELKARIKEDLIEEEKKRFNHEVEEKIIDELIRKVPFDVPSVMVNNYLSSVLEEDKKRRPDVPSEEEREKEIRELFYDSAIRTVKKYFVLEAIKEQEDVQASDEEIKARIEKLLDSGGKKQEIKEFLLQPQQKSRLEQELKDEKVLNLLRENADIVAA